MVTALITGITGQDGAYLAKLLLSKDYEVYGFASRRVNQAYENLDYLGITDQVKIIFGDMTDHSSIANAIKTSNPDEIYKLAKELIENDLLRKNLVDDYTKILETIIVPDSLEKISNYITE